MLTFTNINFLRQFCLPNTFIHGIFRDGGLAANVIPAYASLEYYFRGTTMPYVKEITEKAIKCAEGACVATGTTFKTSIYECPYDDFVINYSLCDMLKEQYEALGITEIQPVPGGSRGSSVSAASAIAVRLFTAISRLPIPPLPVTPARWPPLPSPPKGVRDCSTVLRRWPVWVRS